MKAIIIRGFFSVPIGEVIGVLHIKVEGLSYVAF